MAHWKFEVLILSLLFWCGKKRPQPCLLPHAICRLQFLLDYYTACNLWSFFSSIALKIPFHSFILYVTNRNKIGDKRSSWFSYRLRQCTMMFHLAFIRLIYRLCQLNILWVQTFSHCCPYLPQLTEVILRINEEHIKSGIVFSRLFDYNT